MGPDSNSILSFPLASLVLENFQEALNTATDGGPEALSRSLTVRSYYMAIGGLYYTAWKLLDKIGSFASASPSQGAESAPAAAAQHPPSEVNRDLKVSEDFSGPGAAGMTDDGRHQAGLISTSSAHDAAAAAAAASQKFPSVFYYSR